MIPRAKSFGMKVAAWSRRLTPEAAEQMDVEFKASPAEIAASSDVVSVHVALNPQTRGLINEGFFARCGPGPISSIRRARR